MNIKSRSLIDYLVIFSFALCLIVFLLFFDVFYDRVIYRGYIETEMWLNQLENGEYAREYYYIVEFLISSLGFTVYEATFVLSMISFLYSIYCFKIWKKRSNFIYYIIVFNIFSLLLVFSPGRTSITLLCLMFAFSNIYPRVNFVGLTLSLLLLLWLHAATLIVIVTVVGYSYVQTFISRRFRKGITKFIIKMSFVIVYSILLGVIFSSGISYVDVVDGAGNILNVGLIFILAVAILYYTDMDMFLLYFILAFIIVIVLGVNASYIYRTLFFPIILGVFYKQMSYENYSIK
ncbi:conserved membrane hypothetical protein [Vibrio chagasii]|nr:conserved membrane hypothetical protein [Vibrio chagasii]